GSSAPLHHSKFSLMMASSPNKSSSEGPGPPGSPAPVADTVFSAGTMSLPDSYHFLNSSPVLTDGVKHSPSKSGDLSFPEVALWSRLKSRTMSNSYSTPSR